MFFYDGLFKILGGETGEKTWVEKWSRGDPIYFGNVVSFLTTP